MKSIHLLLITLLIFNSCDMNRDNPLLKNFDTPYQTVPFSKIREEHFIPALKEAVKIAKNNIDKILLNPEKPSFKNVIEELEYSDDKLGQISTIFYNLSSAQNTEVLQEISEEFSMLVSEYYNDFMLNEEIFSKIKIVYDNRENENLTEEQHKLLEDIYLSFSRNGADLPKDKKDELKKINLDLTNLYVKFGQNVLRATNNTFIEIENQQELNGISENYLNSAKKLAEEKNKKGWVFDIDAPTYVEVMKNAVNRNLRKKMYKAFSSKSFKGDYNNEQIVLQIVENRIKLANILGYESYSDYVLERTMAKNKNEVMSFLDELLNKSLPYAKKELEELQIYAGGIDDIDTLKPWDYTYYSDKLQQKKFDFNDDVLKPYFKLENCERGMFDVANKLYGIFFDQVHNIDKYHDDVKTYEVKNDRGELLAIFYVDYFPRKEKRAGAWMTSYREQYKKNGKSHIPHISIVCNFTKPYQDTPSLLTFNEFVTLFHEFGHALHGMLSDVTYESLSGTNVYRDFVELPSQLMENWCYEKEVLSKVAKHYQTEENVPEQYLEKVKDLKKYMAGYSMIRQINFGILDMSWHNLENMVKVKSVEDFEKVNTQRTSLFPGENDTNISCQFSHIFDGAGYAAGYYSYKWAEILEADAFKYFKQKGIFDNEVANSFKNNILSKGGTQDPMVLYEKFRGDKPSTDALLEKLGLK